jgi:surfactin synthase thioesterase subunit
MLEIIVPTGLPRKPRRTKDVTSVRTNAPTLSPWIRRFHPADDAKARLVCFPHAGGSASYYFPVSRALSPGCDVLAVQYPGRQDRRSEACVDDVHRLADLAAEELRGWADRPLLLFGHSLGASLGYEVALRLEASGVELLGLFASGRRAPSRWRDERVHLLPEARLVETLTKMSGTDAAILGDPELLRAVLPAIRGDYKAAETYRCLPDAPKMASPIRVLIGDDDPEVTLDEAESWAGHTAAGYELTVFAGGHFYLNEHAPAVIAAIRRRFSEAGF